MRDLSVSAGRMALRMAAGTFQKADGRKNYEKEEKHFEKAILSCVGGSVDRSTVYRLRLSGQG